MAHPYASMVKASQKRRMSSLKASAGKAHGSVSVDLKNSYKNAGTQREYTIAGSSAKPRADRYAKGGKVKKGNTTNVIIAQPKGDTPPPPRPVPVPVPVRPPMAAAPPAAPPVVAAPGAAPMGPPPGLPVGARPPGLKKGGSVSPSPILPNSEIYHNEGKGYATGGSVKKADGGFLRETPGETYRGFPHSPTTSVDDAVSAHKAGGGVKKHARGGRVEESKAHEAKESKAKEDSESDGMKKGGSVKKRAFGGMGGLPAPQQGGGIPLPMPPQMAKQRAAKMAAIKAKAGQKPQGGLGAPMGGMGGFKHGGVKKKLASGGDVEGSFTQADADKVGASAFRGTKWEHEPHERAYRPKVFEPMGKDAGMEVAYEKNQRGEHYKGGGGVKAGSGSGLGRLRESAIAAKVPAKTEA